MLDQVRVLVSFHTDFSLFITNPALIRVLRRNFDEVSDFEYPNSIPRSSSKKNRLPLLRAHANTLLMVDPLW